MKITRATVSTHSRPKAAGGAGHVPFAGRKFQHTAARRRLVFSTLTAILGILFQHTAARRRLGQPSKSATACRIVSTHSRPKAAGRQAAGAQNRRNGFNTQPPEGGWVGMYRPMMAAMGVSTHSRPKAAGQGLPQPPATPTGFNTQPPEGGWLLKNMASKDKVVVSTHSRPKAAGRIGFVRHQFG